ncbi:hypothetical protein LOK49_LG12G02058 [Camellia lanceoleosa]|uniref:Uncharacterized protein n=1 Tax=Camellia lanceoleosa TaxID=1840588 RepID=A0ACC0FN93_9ERIC|nr:hypothetical protein LOK49_LG12G02058 [Camellia lanceoleosa]
MDIDSQTNNQLPRVITLEEISAAACDDKLDRLEIARLYNEIWDEIKKNAKSDNDVPRIYIISWNDHFFVLKVDVNAYYIIDTFGEWLFERCNQAYILRFDDSVLMRGKVKKEGISSDQASEDEICSGKECCREFMKRFLAAIPLRELELEEKKEPVSYFALHQQLQIEFNFTTSLSLSSSSSAASTNSTSSLFSNEKLLSINPLELKFPFELKKQISSSFQLLNKTDKHVAFKVKTTKPKKRHLQICDARTGFLYRVRLHALVLPRRILTQKCLTRRQLLFQENMLRFRTTTLRSIARGVVSLAAAATMATISISCDSPPPALADSLMVAFPVSRAPVVNTVQRTLVEAWALIRETFVDPTFNHQD